MAVCSLLGNRSGASCLRLIFLSIFAALCFRQKSWMDRVAVAVDQQNSWMMLLHRATPVIPLSVGDEALSNRTTGASHAMLQPPPSSNSTASMHDVIRGRYGDFGFFYIGLGEGDRGFCNRLRKSVGTLRASSSTSRCIAEGRCRVAFLGDGAGSGRVRRDCPEPFHAILQRNLTGCLEGVDARARKLCVRARGPLPFTYSVFLDADTLMTATGDLELIFDVLRAGFDYAAAWECCARRLRGRERLVRKGVALLQGWELQTGVLGLSNCRAVQRHAEIAIQITQERAPQIALTSAEQSFETIALAQSDLRVFTLPPNFNMRSYTAEGYQQMPIHVVHSKSKKEIAELVDRYNLTFG